MRIDDPAALRDLARRWRNCLANLIGGINDGEYAFYLWGADGYEAGCLLRRRGRLGWFVEEIKGPRNREPAPPAMEAILAAFGAADIPRIGVAELIDDIGSLADDRRRGGPGRRVPFEAQDVELADDDADAADEPHEEIDWRAVDDILCVTAWEDDAPMAEAA
jgi:hypothetical protein